MSRPRYPEPEPIEGVGLILWLRGSIAVEAALLLWFFGPDFIGWL